MGTGNIIILLFPRSFAKVDFYYFSRPPARELKSSDLNSKYMHTYAEPEMKFLPFRLHSFSSATEIRDTALNETLYAKVFIQKIQWKSRICFPLSIFLPSYMCYTYSLFWGTRSKPLWLKRFSKNIFFRIKKCLEFKCNSIGIDLLFTIISLSYWKFFKMYTICRLNRLNNIQYVVQLSVFILNGHELINIVCLFFAPLTFLVSVF